MKRTPPQTLPLVLFALVVTLLAGLGWLARPVGAARSLSAALPLRDPYQPTTIYSQNFEGAIGPEWSHQTAGITPNDAYRYLGQFRDEQVTLTLDDLPAHDQLTLSFRLFVIGSWDGVHPDQGPEIWEVGVDGGPTLLRTTFSIWDTPDLADWFQNYPDSYPDGPTHPGRSAADGTFGYGDSYYDMVFTVDHTAESITFVFDGQLGGNPDEFWGIDSLVVTNGDTPGLPDPAQPGNHRLYSEDEQSRPAAAIDNGGTGYALWTDGRDGSTDILTNLFGSNSRVNDDNGRVWQEQADLVVDASGGQYAIWRDGRDGDDNLYFSYRPSPYDSWSANELVNVAGTTGQQYEPALAVDGDGNAYAVWTNNHNDNEDVFFAYRPAGGSWQPAEDAHSSSSAGQNRQDIAVDSTGNAYVVWADNRNNSRDLYFSSRSAAGVWTAEEQVNDLPGSVWTWDPASPSIASDPDGNLTVLWTDQRNSTIDIYSDYRPAGGSWDDDLIVVDDPGTESQFDPSLAVDETGTAYAIWEDTRGDSDADLFFAYRPVGGVWSQNEQLPGFPVGLFGWREQPSISVNDSGQVYAAWRMTVWQGTHYDDNVYSAYWSEFGGWVNEEQLNQPVQDQADNEYSPSIVAGSGGQVYAAWADDGRQHNSPDIFWGYPPEWENGRTFRINDEPLGETAVHHRPDLAMDAAGNQYAVWVDGRDTYCMWFGVCFYDVYFAFKPHWGDWQPAERVNDPNQPISAYAPSWDWSLHGPSIAADDSGNAYVLWIDDRTAGGTGASDRQVYFDYRPAGGSWGTDELVNDVNDNFDRSHPNLAVDPFGNAYAVWVDGRYGDGLHLYGAYRPAGGGWQTNERVDNSPNAGSVGSLDIVSDPAGNFHVAWLDSNTSYSLFYAQRPFGDDWSSREEVNSGLLADFTDGVSLAVDPAGEPAIVWMEARGGDEDVYISRRLAGLGWSGSLRLNDDSGSDGQRDPDIAFDGNGVAHIAWTDERNSGDRGRDVYYTQFIPKLVSPVHSSLVVADSLLLADESFSTSATVTLVDIYGDPIANRWVSIESNSSSVIIDQPNSLTDVDGRVYATIYSGEVQTTTISAVDQQTGLPINDRATIVFAAGPMDPNESYAIIEPATALAGHQQTVTVTAVLIDIYGNPIPYRPFRLSADNGEGGEGGGQQPIATQSSDAAGQVFYTFTWEEDDFLELYIEDTVYEITDFVGEVEFIEGPADPENHTLTVNPTSFYAGEWVTVEGVVYALSGRIPYYRDFELWVGDSLVGVDAIYDGEDNLYFDFSWETAGTFAVSLRDTQHDVSIPLDTLEVAAGPMGGPSTIVADPTAIAPLDAEATVITATLYDHYGNLATNRPVVLAFDTYWGRTEVMTGTTDLSGQAVFTATWPYSEWVNVVIVDSLFNQDVWRDTTLIVGLGEMSPLNSTATMTPTAILGNENDATVISATIRDVNNQPIAGRHIQFRTDDYTHMTGYTDINGRIVFTFTTPYVGNDVVVDLVDGPYGTRLFVGLLDLLPGPVSAFSQLSADKTTVAADGLDSALITATIYDVYGRLMPNTPVVMTATGTVTLNQFSLVTNAAGVITATIRSTDLQTSLLTVAADGVVLDYTPTFTFIPGPAAAGQSDISIVPTQVIADGAHIATVSGLLRDAAGHSVINRPLEIVVSGTDNQLVPGPNISTNASGNFNFTLASTTIETKTLSLIDGDYLNSVPLGQVEFTTPARSTFEAAPTLLTADGIETAVLTVTLRETDNSPISGLGVAVQLNSGQYTRLNGVLLTAGTWITIGVSGPDGVVTATLTSTRAELKELVARSQEETIADTVQLAFQPGPASQLQLLLPGQTAVPGALPGQSGSPSDQTAGNFFTVTVRAVDAYWNLVTTVTNTVNLTTTDLNATLPPTVTLAGGQASVQAQLVTAGSQTFTAGDSQASLTGVTSASVAVAAGPAVRLSLSLPADRQLLQAADTTVAAYDAYDNLADGYRGTVHFSSSDPQATLPANHAFTAGDAGDHLFSNAVTFRTSGSQVVTVTDTLLPSLLATATVSVSADVLINQNTTWNEDTVTLNSLTVTGNAVLTLQGNTTLTATTVTIHSGSTISADGQGFGPATGPGAGGSAGWTVGGGGGAHGGWGGYGNGNSGGNPYDSVYQPAQAGSGGGNGNGLAGGAGGGAIHLIADTVMISGTLSAGGGNGSVGQFDASGGGAGGAIWLEAENLIGIGSIRANGGSGYSNSYANAGGGAGGRLALYVQTDTFNGDLQAYGGSGYQAGGPGTIYQGSSDSLLINNNGSNGASAALIAGHYQFDDLQLRQYGHLYLLDTTSMLTLTTGAFGGDGTARLASNGRFVGGSSLTISGLTLVVEGDLLGVNNLTTAGSGGLQLHANTPWHSGIYTFSQVAINDGTTLRLISHNDGDNNYDDDFGLTIYAEDLTVSDGGMITADGQGYGGAAGPGAGPTGGGTFSPGAGAGYGGRGLNSSSGLVGGAVYGSIYEPAALGSGGGHAGGAAGGAGGGAIRLIVSDTLQVDGPISSNGNSAGHGGLQAAGSGSGGSIWLTAANFGGSGTIRANGGSGGTSGFGNAYGRGGGGAGGRIAVYATNDTFGGTYSVQPGDGGACPTTSCQGTLYFNRVDPAGSTLEAAPTTLVADGQSSSTVTVTLLVVGGAPVSGNGVELRLTPGSGVYLNGQPASGYEFIGNSDSNGLVTAVLTATATGSHLIEARSVYGEMLLQITAITFTVGPTDPDASLLVANKTTIVADGNDQATLTATLYDSLNHPLAGKEVRIQATGTNITLTQPVTLTNAAGQVQATIRSAAAQTVYITAVDITGGITLTRIVTLTFTPAPAVAANSSFVITPTVVPANNQLTTTITAILRDALNRPIANRPAQLFVTGSNNSISPSNIVTTTAEGVAVFYLASAKAETKQISVRDVVGGVTLPAGSVVFEPVPVSGATSYLIVSNNTAAANGLAQIAVEVVVRDPYNNLIEGATVVLTSTGNVTFQQPAPTGANGRTIGYVSSAVVGSALIQAIADGVLIDDDRTVYFEGPDLFIDKIGPANVTTGYPITYSISVANLGLMAATDVVVTDTLPNHVSNISHTAPYSYTYDSGTRKLVWQIGTLNVGQVVNFTVSGDISVSAPVNGTLTNQITGRPAEPELDPANNQDTVGTQIKAPVPQLNVTPLYPTLVMPTGVTSTLVITLSNSGTGKIVAASAAAPVHIPWATINQTSLGDILPGHFVTLTLTVDTSAVTTHAHYRDRLAINTLNAGAANVFLDIHVRAPLRDVLMSVENNLGDAVPAANVSLAEPITLVTEGITSTTTYYRQGVTNSQGDFLFFGLETGKPYNYTVEAINHDSTSSSVNVVTGSGPQPLLVTLNGLAGLSVSPSGLTFEMLRGNLAQQRLVIQNTGVADLSDIEVSAAGIPFIFLGQIPPDTVLGAGESISVSVNAAPLLTEAADIYNGSILVTAGNGDSRVTSVQVRLRTEQERDLCVEVRTDMGEPLLYAELRLTDQVGKIVSSGGVTETLQQVYSQQIITGTVCFEGLSYGPYHIDVGRGTVRLGQDDVEVIPGDGTQHKLVIIDEPAVTATWSVFRNDIEDVYTTVFTLTFIPHAVPRLALSPDRINLCGDADGTVTEMLTLHNFYPITLTNTILDLNYAGNVTARVTNPENGSSTDGSQPLDLGILAPNEHMELELEASVNMAICQGDQGLINIDVNAQYEHFVPESWYRLDGSPAQAQPGQEALIPLRLANIGFPAESNLNSLPPDLENVTLIPPQTLTWMDVSTDTFDLIPVGEEVAFDLVVTPPPYLAQGMYYDYIQVSATNGITALIGIEAEMGENGLHIETQFVTPLTAGQGGGGGGGIPAAPPVIGQPPQDWDDIVTFWNPDVFGPQDAVLGHWDIMVGCYCSSGGGGGWFVVGNSLVNIRSSPTPGPGFAFSPDFKDNVVILELQQRFSLEREAFTAQLNLSNGLAQELTDVEVTIAFMNGTGNAIPTRDASTVISPTGNFVPALPANSLVPTQTMMSGTPGGWQKIYPVNFITIPETPTALDNIPGGQNRFVSWALIPDAAGLREQAYFTVQAIIRYKVNGVEKVLITSPSTISVSPQPRIVIDYFIPNYVLGGQTFDWLVVATNVGYGTARNFRVETPQPKIIKQSEMYPTDFTLIGPSVLSWGDVGPGQQVSGIWRILPSNPGSFVDWKAECKHQNYMGVELPPLVYCVPRVHIIDTSYLAESQQWGKGDNCLASLFQDFINDPVNSYSGNFTYSQQDVSIPGWGPGLHFERSYNSRDEEDGPFGPGWTHNYNMYLTYENFVGVGPQGAIGQFNYFGARLPHGSFIYFNLEEDDSFTPFPGVRASLERDFVTYTMTQECDQYIYTYNADQKLIRMEDANGNQINLSYDVSGELLTAVTDPSGRSLTFTYDGQGHITSMTDPLGRTAVYTYTMGYLSAAQDFRGGVTRYTYTLPGNQPAQLRSIIDPNGHVEVFNHYNEDRRVDWQEDAADNRTTFAYSYDPDTEARSTTVTDPLGNYTIDFYDANGLLVRWEDAYGNTEQYEYDDYYNAVRKVDENNHATQYVWDECGCELQQVIDPLGYTTLMTFNDQHQPLTIRNERGNTTNYVYDLTGMNALIVTNPAGGQQTFTYESHGEKLSETDENGRTIYYGYDSYGNTVVITDALGQVTHMAYDLAGRLLSTTDALGRTTSYAYDPGNQPLVISNALSGTTSLVYDPAGNMTLLTDALGRQISYDYDERNLLVRLEDPLGGAQVMGYDANRNLISQTSANGHTTTYLYDALNRRIRVTNPLSGTVRYTYDPAGNLLSETDPNGNRTQYVYDANNRVIETIYDDDSSLTAVYDPADNLLTLTDGEGRTVVYTYDLLGRVQTMRNPENGLTTYGYDAVGNQISLLDPAGRTTTYDYDALNRLVEVTNPLGDVTSFAYDAVGNQISVTDANGETASLSYDDLDRLIQTTDPLNGTSTVQYDAVGNATGRTDPLGRLTTISYDALNRPVIVTDPLNSTTTYLYDPVGNVLQVTDPEGHSTSYGYDALNRNTTITDALSGLTTLGYDANGNLLSRTDAEGRTTSYAYDLFNQVILMTNALSGTTTYEYDHVGNLLVATDPLNRTIQYSYDGRDLLLTAQDALSGTTQYLYDPVGNLLTLTDPEGHSTYIRYDGLNRPVTVTNALNHVTGYHYDANGNLVRLVDSEGRQTLYSYDALNRLVNMTDALGHTTTYSYDAVGNQVGLVDALGRPSSFSYDSLDRLVTLTNPISGTTVYSYSASGRLIATQNAEGQLSQYQYDSLYRPVQTVNALGQSASYQYDAVGNLLSLTDIAGRTTTFAYDDLNRLVQVTNPLAGVRTMAYDAVGNQLAQTDENGHSVGYAYDALNRLVAVTDPLAQVTTFSYDRVGNTLAMTDPLSRTTSYSYDAVYRPVTLTDPAGGLTSYSYDRVDNLLSQTDAAGRTTDFAYNPLNRLITVTNPLNDTLLFSYDAVGNQTQVIDEAGRVMTYTYDALDRPVVIINPLNQATQYDYDLVGNLVALTDAANHITHYQYDPLNRLALVTNPLSGTMAFSYDVAGNLVLELDELNSPTHYGYDNLDRLISLTDALSNTTSFAYDPVGNVLAMTDANGANWQMAYDPLNRVITETNPLGNLATYRYDAVGNNTSISDPLGNESSFSYDLLDRLATVTDALNQTTSLAYDAVGNQVSMTDAAGVVTRYQYDPLNRLTQVTENYISGGPQNSTTNITNQFSYDAVGNLTAMTNPLGHTFSYSYDALNRMANSADPLGNDFSYSYDVVGNLAGLTDANGAATSYNYDALNRLTNIVRPDETVSFSYDAAGNRLTMSDLTGLTSYSYDAIYRLTAVTDPLAQTVQYQYDPAGNRTGLTYPGGDQVTYAYDTANRLLTVTDWDNGQTEYTYDDAGRLLQLTLPNGITGTLAYDAANQLTLIQYENLTGTLASYAYSYDQVGNRIEAIETVIVPSLVPTAVFTATPLSGASPLTVTFHNNSLNANSYTWDFGDGQVLTTTSAAPLNHIYNQSGLYTVTLTAENADFSHTSQRTNYIQVVPPDAFQEIGGLLVIEAEHPLASIPRSGQSWLTRTALAGYQGDSYLQAAPDRNRLYGAAALTNSPELQYQANFATAGTYTVWLYGNAPNSQGDSVHIGLDGQGSAAVTSFAPRRWGWSARSSSGLTATLTIANPGLHTIHVWVREDGFRLDRILLTLDGQYIPAAAGPPESPRAGDLAGGLPLLADAGLNSWFTVKEGGVAGPTAAEQRSQLGVVAARVLLDPGFLLAGPLGLLAPFAYSRRRRRQVQGVAALVAILVLFSVGWSLAYGAGLSGELGADLPFVPLPSERLNPLVQESAAIGNHQALLDLAQQSSQLRTISYSYDPLYRLTGADYSSGESFAYSYDAAGNRLAEQINGGPATDYVYDAANRLIQVETQAYSYDNNGNLLNDGVYSYSYDSANRLTSVEDGISSLQYLYNGDGNRVAQIADGLRTDFVQDVNRPLPQLLTSRQGGTVTQYLFGLGLIGEEKGGTGPMAGPAVWQYSLPDAIGSVRQLTDAQGQVTMAQHFDPFGNVMSAASNTTTTFGFAGEEQDPASGLVYLRARTYNPTTGRFLQQDSVFGDPSQPRTLHRYSYAFSSPVTYTDPSGHMPGGGGGGPGGGGGGGGSGGDSGGSPAGSGQGGDGGGGGGGGGGGEERGGLRDSFCGFLREAIRFGIEVAAEVIAIAEAMPELITNLLEFQLTGDPSHLLDAFNTAASIEENSERIETDIYRFIGENFELFTIALQIAISFIPIVGTLYDLASLIEGRDIITGEPLTPLETVLTVVGLVSSLDEIGELFEAGVKHADELANFMGAGKHGDELLDGLKYGDEAADAARSVNRLDEAAQLADEVASLGDEAAEIAEQAASHVDEAAAVADEAAAMADEAAAMADEAAGFTDEAADSAPSRQLDESDDLGDEADGAMCPFRPRNNHNSFTAGTLVETEAGPVAIEDIKIGDRVLAEDPETGEQSYYEVVALTNHPTTEVVAVTIGTDEVEDGGDNGQETADDEDGDDDSAGSNEESAGSRSVMFATPDHPVYVEGKGWIWAENLAIGDRLRRADGGMATVLALEQRQLEEPVAVYNFTVAGVHTYFVLDAQLLVHNEPDCGIHPPEESGITPKMENDIVKTIDDDGTAAFRSRPPEAAGLESQYGPKEKWVEDWMVTNYDKTPGSEYDQGIRNLIDYDHLNDGTYPHIERAETGDGYNIRPKGKMDEEPVFVSDAEIEYARQHNRLNGEQVLSDFDVAGYTRSSVGVVGDQPFRVGFGRRFNNKYGNDIIMHGHLYNGLHNEKVVKKLSRVEGRIDAIRSGDVYLFDKRGYIGQMSYNDYHALLDGGRTEFRTLFDEAGKFLGPP